MKIKVIRNKPIYRKKSPTALYLITTHEYKYRGRR